MNEDEIKSAVFTLDRFEDGNAVLIGEHFEIVIPKKLIPKKLEPGDIVHLTLSSDEAETKKREQKAKDILNEILKS
jgi:hypothetical protein